MAPILRSVFCTPKSTFRTNFAASGKIFACRHRASESESAAKKTHDMLQSDDFLRTCCLCYTGAHAPPDSGAHSTLQISIRISQDETKQQKNLRDDANSIHVSNAVTNTIHPARRDCFLIFFCFAFRNFPATAMTCCTRLQRKNMTAFGFFLGGGFRGFDGFSGICSLLDRFRTPRLPQLQVGCCEGPCAGSRKPWFGHLYWGKVFDFSQDLPRQWRRKC